MKMSDTEHTNNQLLYKVFKRNKCENQKSHLFFKINCKNICTPYWLTCIYMCEYKLLFEVPVKQRGCRMSDYG